MKYLIKRVVPIVITETKQGLDPVEVEIDGAKVTLMRPVTIHEEKTVNTLEDAEEFEEKPAPDVTLGGRLLALKNETGFEHVAVEAPPEKG